ncbi:uncharacterized protein L3040_006591 [Drepanopeziza brunnea f. sp. 'multigermtubi']|uniref:uncharacterized protein n=1 Tax=Drepanopeziza brunnea f. sp. 'multigermtubi' TaxID=698441 RepID=UPI00239F1EBB|nr:hypothetical protein L3040_006591 [Drepanopeziza brunnea f. sp. 'multigermtubi']
MFTVSIPMLVQSPAERFGPMGADGPVGRIRVPSCNRYVLRTTEVVLDVDADVAMVVLTAVAEAEEITAEKVVAEKTAHLDMLRLVGEGAMGEANAAHQVANRVGRRATPGVEMEMVRPRGFRAWGHT